MKLDRRLFGALGLSGLVAAGCARAAPAEPTTFDEALDQTFATAGSPGLGAVVLNREGVIWSGVRGVRRKGGEDAVQIDDRWHLGSNTKAMTSLLYARMVEAGRARWGATLGELFDGVTVDPALASTLIETVMAHRAGLSDSRVIGMSWLMTARDDARPRTEQRAELAARALGAPPDGTPGAYAYANINYIVLGAALERMTGESWEALMRRELFTPLAITSGGFGAPPDPSPWGHRNLFSILTPMDPASPASDNPQALGPAGTAHMNLADYARWLGVFLDARPEGFVSADSLTRLTTTPEGADYALGWGVYPQRSWATGPVLAHEGSNTMWRVMAAVAPEGGLACAVAANRDTDACAPLGVQLMRLAAGRA